MSTQEERICPTNTDLQRQMLGSEANQIKSHVDNCLARTKAFERHVDFTRLAQSHLGSEENSLPNQVPENLKDLFAQRSVRFQQLMHLALPEERQFGQIWTTKYGSEDKRRIENDNILPRIIVLLEDEPENSALDKPFLVAAPISIEIAYRANYDLKVFKQESLLGYPFMIEVWNRVSPLVDQLERYLGTLQQPLKTFLGLVYQAHLGVPVDLGKIAQHLGPAILQPNDPRVHFQEQELEACDYLRRPLLEMLKRAETKALEADRPRSVVLFQKKLPVKYGQPPLFQQKASLPLAAADAQTQVLSHFIHIQGIEGELIAKMRRDFRTDSLYLAWEHLPQTLQGTKVSILLHTDTGRTLIVGESIVQQGDHTLLSQGEHLGPSQIESLSLEFRGQEDE